MVDFQVRGVEDISLAGMADTGSLQNRFGLWVAREAGFDLSSCELETIGIGGRAVLARTVVVGLSVNDFRWEAPVSFCEPWPWMFQVLGQEGFFRFFDVRLQAANRRLSLTPTRR